MDQKLWVFEVFRKSLGRAGANEEELTTFTKIWEQGVGRRKEGATIKGDPRKSGQRPAVDRALTSGRPGTNDH
jgi:hypothetical protein